MSGSFPPLLNDRSTAGRGGLAAAALAHPLCPDHVRKPILLTDFLTE